MLINLTERSLSGHDIFCHFRSPPPVLVKVLGPFYCRSLGVLILCRVTGCHRGMTTHASPLVGYMLLFYRLSYEECTIHSSIAPSALRWKSCWRSNCIRVPLRVDLSPTTWFVVFRTLHHVLPLPSRYSHCSRNRRSLCLCHTHPLLEGHLPGDRRWRRGLEGHYHSHQ